MSNIYKKSKIPFALTTLCLLLSACGGGSNTINEDPLADLDDDTAVSCDATNCLPVVLDETPVENVNYICGSYRGITGVQGVAYCPIDSQITFYLKATKGSKKIFLGTTTKLKVPSTATTTITLKNLAESINASEITDINDAGAKTAINLSRLLYTLNDNHYVDSAPANRIAISNTTLDAIENLKEDINAADFKDDTYIDKLKPLLTATKKELIASDKAKARLNKTILASNTGVLYTNPESGTLLGQFITGSTNTSNKFAAMAILSGINRAGKNFGFGAYWAADYKFSGETEAESEANKYLVYLRNGFSKMSYKAGDSNPYTQRLNNWTFSIDEGNYQNSLIKFKGKLLRNAAIVSTADQYKSYTDADIGNNTEDLGRWQQSGSVESFNGNAYFLKTDQAASYLDSNVWKVKGNVATTDSYYFPLHAQLVFTNSQAYVDACNKLNPKPAQGCSLTQSVNITFLESGDIVSDFADAGGSSCGNVDPDTLIDNHGVQQYAIGTVRAATSYGDGAQFILPHIILSGQKFKDLGLDGMVLGSETWTDKFKINVAGLASPSSPSILATNSDDPAVSELPSWFNVYNYFTWNLVNYADEKNKDEHKPTVNDLQKASALNVSGTFKMQVNSACSTNLVK